MRVLEEAAEITSKDRRDFYGLPAENHGCTAELWTAYLRRRLAGSSDPDLDAVDVCMLNILQKVSRLAHSRQRDGLVDIAGYAANAEECGDEMPGEGL